MSFIDECSIIEKDIPYKYGLSYNFKRKVLIIEIHTAVIEFLKKFLDSKENYDIMSKKIIRSTMRELWNPRDKLFGFENIFLLRKVSEDFTEFEIPLAELRNHWGYDPFLNISRTFTALTEILQDREIKTSHAKKQILNFKTVTHQDLHGGSLYGEFGIGITSWSKSAELKGKILTGIEDIAFEASKMIWKHENYRMQFEVYTGDLGGFYVSIPGDACGINPESSYDLEENEAGYLFDCHNVDNAQQQLLLLVIIAAICDMYKFYRKTTPI